MALLGTAPPAAGRAPAAARDRTSGPPPRSAADCAPRSARWLPPPARKATLPCAGPTPRARWRRAGRSREGMAWPRPSAPRDGRSLFAEDFRRAVAQRDPLARVEREHAIAQAAARHLGQQAATRRAVVAARVVRLEVDGHHRRGTDVVEDVQRLLWARMAPAVQRAARTGGCDGDEREVDAWEAGADLAEDFRVVACVAGEVHAPAGALDHVSRRGVVPQRVDAVATPLVTRGHRRDGEAAHLERFPDLERTLPRLRDLVRVRLAAVRKEDRGVASQLAHRGSIEVVHVHVADQR